MEFLLHLGRWNSSPFSDHDPPWESLRLVLCVLDSVCDTWHRLLVLDTIPEPALPELQVTVVKSLS